MKLLTLLILLTSQLCLAQNFTFNQGAPTTKNYYQEIPYENVQGKLFVTVEIAGKKHRFLFDTGAPVAISKPLADSLGAKVIHMVKMVDNYQGSDSTTVVELNGLKLGDLTFDHIPAINLFPEFYKCMHIDGVIGSNLFHNSILSINSQKGLLIITDKKNKLDLKSANSAKLITDQGIQSDPKIEFYINKRVHAIIAFDTGDSQFIRMSDWLTDQLKPYGVVDSIRSGYGSGGLSAFGAQKSAFKTLYSVAPFTIGNGKFSNLTAVSNKSESAAIGSKLLEYGTITLDFINKKFYFDAYQPNIDLTQKRWNANYGFVDGKLVIAEVWDQSIGVEQGSQVLAINGVDLSHITLCDYINNSRSFLDGKEQAEFTLKTSKGDIKKVILVKR